MCSGFFQPSYKRGKYLFFKGAEKGQIIVAMRYDLLLPLFPNSYITSMSVIICYNSLQSVKSQIEMVRIEGYDSTITVFIMFVISPLSQKGQKRGNQK